MDIIAEKLSEDATYKLLVGLIVPRPIAWVTSVSSTGVVNLAPFSAFTYLSTSPALVGITVSRREGKLKDTARNIEATGEFVINIADDSLVEPLHSSSAEDPPTASETERLGLKLLPSVDIRTPRLAIAPASLECRLEQAIEFGDLSSRLIVGRVIRFHIRDELLEDGKVMTDRLRPIGRIGGPRYTKLGEIVSMAPLHRKSNQIADSI